VVIGDMLWNMWHHAPLFFSTGILGDFFVRGEFCSLKMGIPMAIFRYNKLVIRQTFI